MAEHTNIDIRELAFFLLDYSVALLAAGTHTERCVRCVSRIAEAYGCRAALMVSQKNISLSLVDAAESARRYTSMNRLHRLAFNFSHTGLLSALSWRVVDERLPLEKLRREFRRLMLLRPRPPWLITFSVAAANASFCRLFGGDAVAMALVFAATALGFLVRRRLAKHRVNGYGTVVICAFLSSIMTAPGICLGWGGTPEVALSTSVLYLVPGVQIINVLMDLINGYPLNSYQRAMDSFVTITGMAIGLAFTMLAIGTQAIGNF